MKPKYRSTLSLHLSLAVNLCILPMLAHAVDSTWTGATDGNWDTTTNWSANTLPANGTCTFNNNVNTSINLATEKSQFRWVFDTAAAGNFSFSGAKFMTISSGQSVAVNANVVATSISFNNPFQVTPTNRNTNFDFNIVNNSSTAILAFNSTMFGSGISTNLGARVNFSGSGTVAINAPISDGTAPGIVMVRKSSTGTLNLSAANSYSGGTESTATTGVIRLGDKSALGTGPLRIIIGSNQIQATTDLSGGNAISNTINYASGNNAATTSNLGLTLTSGSNVATWTAGTAPAVGDMVTGGGALPFYTRVTAVSGTAGSGTITFSNPASLSGAASNYTTAPFSNGGSATTLIGGSQNIEFAGTVNLSTVWSTGAAVTQTFDISNTADTIFSGILQQQSGVANVTKTGAGKMILTNANTYTGNTTITAGILALGNGGSKGSLATSGTLTNNGNLTVNRNNTVIQGVDFNTAAITGTGSFTQAGAGTTILTAANTYTGGTTINAGTLQMGNNGTTGSFSNTGTVTNNGKLVFNRTNAITTSALITGTGDVIQNNPTASYTSLNLTNAANSYSGVTRISNGFLSVGANSILSGVNGPLGNSTSAIILGDASTMASTFGGSGPNAILQVYGINNTDVQDYTIDRDIDSSVAANVGGRNNIQFRNDNPGARGTLTVSGKWTLSSGNLRTNGVSSHQPNMMLNLTGELSGGNNATRFRINDYGQGVGIVRISNPANSYASQTIVTSGTLLIAGDAAATSGVLGTHSTLSLAEGGNSTPENTALIDGAWTVGKLISLANGATANSTWTLGGNQARVSSFTGNVVTETSDRSRTLRLSQVSDGSVSFTGVIGANPNASFVTNVDKIGSGKVILSGNNTYDGTTNVSAGTLEVNGQVPAGAVTIASGATSVEAAPSWAQPTSPSAALLPRAQRQELLPSITMS